MVKKKKAFVHRCTDFKFKTRLKIHDQTKLGENENRNFRYNKPESIPDNNKIKF